ncbi:MAG: glycosyltransferase family 41 protein [Gemmataceae bacterium]|nr:glycosyltransferase family 41 protein [Gemmataceae bacterium]
MAIDESASQQFELALSFHQSGNMDHAEMLYREILKIDPTHLHALSNLGTIQARKGNLETAIDLYRRALEQNKDFGECWFNLGNALRRGMNPAGAEAAFVHALRCNPTLYGAALGLGQALTEQGKLPQAIEVFKQILAQKQDDPDLYSHLGTAQRLLGQRDEAMRSYDAMRNLRPNDPRILHQYGLVLLDSGKNQEALDIFTTVLSLRPDYPEAHNSMSIVLQFLNRDEESLKHNLEAVRLRQDFTEAWNNLGNLYGLMGKPQESVDAFTKAVALQPNAVHFHSNLLLNMHYLPDLDPKELYQEHRKWETKFTKGFPPAAPFGNNREPERKLRLGILSPDFRKHTVVAFIEPFMNSLDRNRVEIHAYSAVLRPDEITERLKKSADAFNDLRAMTDLQVAGKIRQDQIDILLDLAGHTAGNRLQVFARRPAPVQITQFGYPNTSGLAAMGYRFTDALADPAGKAEELYIEKLVRLEGCSWCYQPPTQGVEVPKRSAKAGAIVFGSLNNMAKHNVKVLGLWAKILMAVPGSRLRLLAGGTQEAARQARHIFQHSQINPDRVEFLSRMEPADYLKAQGEIDIALDPFPYNGGVTTCDAFWMGTPVLTLEGNSYVSRQGVSLNSALGLEDWIARTADELVAKAKQFASEPARLTLLRGKLRGQLLKSSVCDWKGYGKKWEAAARGLWRQWCAGDKDKVLHEPG